MRLISIFTFFMSNMVMYRSNSDHNVVCRDIWFRIKRNLGPFLVTFRSLLTSSEVPKVPNSCWYISGSRAINMVDIVAWGECVGCVDSSVELSDA